MRCDPAADAAMRARMPRRRRRPGLPMLSALLRLARQKAEVVRHHERPWASITFTGTRHTVTLRFSGDEAIAAGEQFIAALPEHEFTLPAELVADATVTSVEHELLPAPALTVTAELLLLDDVPLS